MHRHRRYLGKQDPLHCLYFGVVKCQLHALPLVQLGPDHAPFKIRIGIFLPQVPSPHKLHHCSGFTINKFQSQISLRSFSLTTHDQHRSLPFTILEHITQIVTGANKYQWIDGAERLEMYVPVGYHPLMIDDLLHDRYRIVDKLGYGGYSIIWLARDETVKRYVAIEIGTSSPSFPRREIEVLRALHSSRSNSSAHAGSDMDTCTALPSILDAFVIHGPNKTHAWNSRMLHADSRPRESQGSLNKSYLSNPSRPHFGCKFSDRGSICTFARFCSWRFVCHKFNRLPWAKLIVSLDLYLQNVLVGLPSTFEELSVEEF